MKSKELADRFLHLEETLGKDYPEVLREAQRLATEVVDPRVANADALWAVIWNKPLFSNTKVSIGARYIEKLSPHMDGAWQHWGTDDSFCIAKTGKGISTASFEAMTDQAKRIRIETGIAMHRLFAIQGAAMALRNRADQRVAPYSDLVDAEISETVPRVQKEMGVGWGHVTVLHFLTDLGLACKPDIHLVRAVRHLGMTVDLQDRKVPSLADAITINRRVRSLVEALDGSVSPSRLRYVDKALMGISQFVTRGAS